MSLSGIGVSPELTEAFSHAIDSTRIRFIKVSINRGRQSQHYHPIIDLTPNQTLSNSYPLSPSSPPGLYKMT